MMDSSLGGTLEVGFFTGSWMMDSLLGRKHWMMDSLLGEILGDVFFPSGKHWMTVSPRGKHWMMDSPLREETETLMERSLCYESNPLKN